MELFFLKKLFPYKPQSSSYALGENVLKFPLGLQIYGNLHA